jgi:transposase
VNRRIPLGRPCKDRQLSRSCLRDLEPLLTEARSLGAGDGVLRMRGLIRVSRPPTYREVAAGLGITSGPVSNWVGNFEGEGPEGWRTKPHPGRPAERTEEELWVLDEGVDAGALASGFPPDKWEARRVASVIRSHLGVGYQPHPVAKLRRARGLGVPKPQRVVALTDAAAPYRGETEVKPQSARRARRKAAPSFFEEELTRATPGTVQRPGACVGQTPKCPTFGRYNGVKAFGAVSGRGGFRYRSTDDYLIFIIDGAPYHQGEAVKDFAQAPHHQIALYYLPGYSPEQNPPEHVWNVFRKHPPHNRCFTSTDEPQVARSGFSFIITRACLTRY